MAEEKDIAEKPTGLALDVHESEPVNEEDRGVDNGPGGSDCGSQGSDYPPDYDHSISMRTRYRLIPVVCAQPYPR
jgi:hypothetical protein